MNPTTFSSEFSSSKELTDQLYKSSIVKTYHEGDIILDENASIRSIPVVMKGLLKVIRTEEDGREILLYYIKAGESCIMSFLGGMHNEKSIVKAEVEEDSEILFLPIDKVSFFIKEYPEWLDYIFRLYHKPMQMDIKNDLKTVEQKARDCKNKTYTAHNLELIMKDSAMKLFSHSFIRQIYV